MFLGIHFIFTLSFIVLIESGVMEDSQGVVDRTAVLSGHEMEKTSETSSKPQQCGESSGVSTFDKFAKAQHRRNGNYEVLPSKRLVGHNGLNENGADLGAILAKWLRIRRKATRREAVQVEEAPDSTRMAVTWSQKHQTSPLDPKPQWRLLPSTESSQMETMGKC